MLSNVTKPPHGIIKTLAFLIWRVCHDEKLNKLDNKGVAKETVTHSN